MMHPSNLLAEFAQLDALQDSRQTWFDIAKASRTGEGAGKHCAAARDTQLAFPALTTKLLIAFSGRAQANQLAPSDGPHSLSANVLNAQFLKESDCTGRVAQVLVRLDHSHPNRQPGGQHRFDPGDRALPASLPLSDAFMDGRVVRVKRSADVNSAPLEATHELLAETCRVGLYLDELEAPVIGVLH
jgi:hypothetical protein